jgi:hypothetical protein
VLNVFRRQGHVLSRDKRVFKTCLGTESYPTERVLPFGCLLYDARGTQITGFVPLFLDVFDGSLLY